MDTRPNPRGMTSEEVVKLQRWVDYQWSKNSDSQPWYIDALGWGEQRTRKIAKLNEHRSALGMRWLVNDEEARPELARLRRLWAEEQEARYAEPWAEE